MHRFFYIIFFFSFFAACSGRKDGVAHRVEGVYALPPNAEGHLPSVDFFIPSFYDIELIEFDTLHPVMQIRYMSRRPEGDNYHRVDAVLRLNITPEQGTQLRELLYEDILPKR